MAHLTPAYPSPLSSRSGYKEQDDLVVFDGADQSQYSHCHQQCATYRNTHQDWDIREVGQRFRCCHQTYQKYTNHLCMGACGGDISIFDILLLPTHNSRLCVHTLHRHNHYRLESVVEHDTFVIFSHSRVGSVYITSDCSLIPRPCQDGKSYMDGHR